MGTMQRKALQRVIPLFILIIVGSITLNYSIGLFDSGVNGIIYIIPFAIAIISMGVTLLRSSKKNRRLWESYCLTISQTHITREFQDMPTISIPINEIQQIRKTKDGSFVIKGVSALNEIAIPKFIENHGRVEELLQNIHALQFSQAKETQPYLSLMTVIISVALMIGVYASTNKIIVGVSGTLLTALLLTAFIIAQRSKNVQKKTKRSIYTVFILLFSVIAVTIAKLLAP